MFGGGGDNKGSGGIFAGQRKKWIVLGSAACLVYFVVNGIAMFLAFDNMGWPGNPFQTRQPGAVQGLPPSADAIASIPPDQLATIKTVAGAENVPWEIPTAILRIESNFGQTNGNNNYAGLTVDQWKQYCDAALHTGFGSGGGGGGGAGSNFQLWLTSVSGSGSTSWSTPVATVSGVWPYVGVRPTDGDVFVVGTDYQNSVYFGDSNGGFAQTPIATQSGAAPARPRGAFDSAGNFYPVWQARAGDGEYHAFIAKVDTGGHVSGQPIDVTAALNLQTGKEPDLAIGSDGRFYLAQEADGGEVGVAVSTDSGQHWIWKRIGSGIAGNTGPRIAIGSNGQAHAVYVNGTDVIASDSSDGGNSWTSGTRLDSKGTPGHRAFWPSIAVDGSGNAFVAWQEDSVATSGSSEISFARFSGGSGWQPEIQNVSHTTTNLAARVPGVAMAGNRLWVMWSVDTGGGAPAGGDGVYSDDNGSSFSTTPTVVEPHTFTRPGPWTAAATGANGNAYFLEQLAGSPSSSSNSTGLAVAAANQVALSKNSAKADFSYLQIGDKGDNQFGLNLAQTQQTVAPADATNTAPPAPTGVGGTAGPTPTPTPEIIHDPCPDPANGLGDTVNKPAPDGNPGIWIYTAPDFTDKDKSLKILVELLSENGAHAGDGPGVQAGVQAFNTDINYFYRVLQVAGRYGFINYGSFEAKEVALTAQQEGKPYVWGAVGPDSFDCSGLVLWVFGQLGVTDIPRNSQAQYYAAVPIQPDQVMPGDLFFLEDTYSDPSIRITHVGIYIGGGNTIHAPEEGMPVQEGPVNQPFFQEHWYGFARIKRPGMIPPTIGVDDSGWSGGGTSGPPLTGDWHDFDIRNGEPTAAAINSWLAQHNSPQLAEAPAGETIGDVYIAMGRRYGINPAFILSIFTQESTCAGLPQDNLAAHDYGNIKWTAGYPEYIGSDGTGWREYATWTDGMEDLFRMLRTFYIDQLNLTSVSDVIAYYEHNDPKNPDGFTALYINHVEEWMTELMSS